MSIGAMHRQKIGNMRHRVTIQKVVETIDAARQLVRTYTDRYIDQPATFEQVSGGEYVRGRQIEAGVNAVFQINNREDLSVEDRVVFGNQNYGIVRIDKPDGIERFAYLYCKAAPVG